MYSLYVVAIYYIVYLAIENQNLFEEDYSFVIHLREFLERVSLVDSFER